MSLVIKKQILSTEKTHLIDLIQWKSMAAGQIVNTSMLNGDTHSLVVIKRHLILSTTLNLLSKSLHF